MALLGEIMGTREATQSLPGERATHATVGFAVRNLPRFASELVRLLWPAYLLASILILCGIGWGLMENPKPRSPVYTPTSFNQDENGVVYAVEGMTLSRPYPRLYDWGTAFFYPVYAVRAVVAKIRHPPVGNRGTLMIARYLVYLSALGAVTMMFLLGRRLFGESTGRLAAIILAVSPGFVIYGHYVKTDIPMIFCLLVAILLAVEVMDHETPGSCVALGLAVGLAASTKYSAVALLPAGIAAIVVGSPVRNRFRALVLYTIAVAAAFLIGTPGVVLEPHAWLAALQKDAALNSTRSLTSLAGPPALLAYPLEILPLAFTVPMLLVAALGFVWAAISHKRKNLLPIWILLASYWLLMARDNTRVLRYSLPFVPFAALFAAYALSEARKIRGVRAAAIPAVVALILYSFVFSLAYVQAMARPDPRLQAAHWIARHIARTEPILTSETSYYNRPQIDQMGYRLIDVGSDISKLQQSDARYFLLSEYTTMMFSHSIWRAKERAAFLEYLRNNYSPTACFENSQTLLGIINTKRQLPDDWLQPNPRICILVPK